ncbi:hypothetical protein AABB24_039786, partial [Solanum stoloniferum]
FFAFFMCTFACSDTRQFTSSPLHPYIFTPLNLSLPTVHLPYTSISLCSQNPSPYLKPSLCVSSMTNTSQVSLRPSKRLKNPSVSFSPVEISDSSMDDLPASSASNKKSSPSGHAIKKHKADSVDFKPEDLQLFWSSVEKAKFMAFKDKTSAPGRVICLNQLEGSHCLVSMYFNFQKLHLFFLLCENEVFEEPVKMYYANLRVSKDNGELETLVLGYCIVLSQDLLEKVFGTKFSGRIPFFSGNWPDDFEVTQNDPLLRKVRIFLILDPLLSVLNIESWLASLLLLCFPAKALLARSLFEMFLLCIV